MQHYIVRTLPFLNNALAFCRNSRCFNYQSGFHQLIIYNVNLMSETIKSDHGTGYPQSSDVLFSCGGNEK